MESKTEYIVVVSSYSEPQPTTERITHRRKKPASKAYMQ